MSHPPISTATAERWENEGGSPAAERDLVMGGVVGEERDLRGEDREGRGQRKGPPRVVKQPKAGDDEDETAQVEAAEQHIVGGSTVEESSRPDFPNQFAVVALEGLMR